jgi:O-antigen/teichoic acid export membrane protein
MYRKLHKILRGPIALGAIQTSGVMGVRLLIQAGTLILLSRLLGPHQFGFFSGLASLALLLGTIATFGLHITLLRDISRNPEARDTVLPKILGTTLLCGSILFVIYILMCNALYRLTEYQWAAVLCIGLAENLVQPFLLLSVTEKQADGRVAKSQIYALLPLIARLTSIIIIYLSHSTNVLLMYSILYLLSASVALIYSLKMAKEKWPSLSNWRILKRKEISDPARYAVLGLTNRAPTELDKVLATQLLSANAAGLYAAASRVLGAIITPITALIHSSIPNLFRLTHRKKVKTAHSLIFITSLIYGSLAGALLYFSEPLILSLFGDKYSEISTYLHCLSLATPALALRLSGCNILMTENQPILRAIIEVSGLLVLFIASASLGKTLNTLSLPIAYTLSEYWTGTLCWLFLYRKSKTLTLK